MRIGKNTSGARQCGLGSPFDPRMHAAGCNPLKNASIFEKLFMVSRPLLDLKCPVNLLQQHHPGQVVWEGHGGHGQAQMGLVLHRLAHAEGATHQEGDIRGSLHHPAT